MMLVFFRSVMVRHRQWACLKLSPAYFSTMNDSRTIEETIQEEQMLDNLEEDSESWSEKEEKKLPMRNFTNPADQQEIFDAPTLSSILAKYDAKKVQNQEDVKEIVLEPPQMRIDVMAHMTRDYAVLIPSNVFPTIRTIGEAAKYVINQIHPPKSRLDLVRDSAPPNLFLQLKRHDPRQGVKVDRPRATKRLPKNANVKVDEFDQVFEATNNDAR